jgi:hypothetical protein
MRAVATLPRQDLSKTIRHVELVGVATTIAID